MFYIVIDILNQYDTTYQFFFGFKCKHILTCYLFNSLIAVSTFTVGLLI